MFKRAILIAALATLISATLFTSSAKAQTDPAPELFQNFVGCYRSIIQADDLFCINRYQLPTFDAPEPANPEAWCQYLLDTNGCTGNPVEPEAPWSLQPGAAFIAIYDDTVLLGQGEVPRIGYSLGGIYFFAGHGITWGDPDIQGCVESSATIFTSFEQSCLPVFWNTEANTEAAQRAKLGTDLVAQFVNLEVEDPLIPLGGYVVNNLINDAGRVIALETLNVLDRILPNTFRSQSLPAVTNPYSTPTGNLPLQDEINATATAFAGGVDNLALEVGTSGDWLGLALFALIGTVAFGVTLKATQSLPLAVVTFLTVMLNGVPLGVVPVAVAAVTALLVFIVGGVFVIKKVALS